MKRLFLAIILVLFASSTGAFWHGNGSGKSWSQLHTGAGGYLSNIIIDQASGTKVVRTDTYGGYIYNPSASNPGNAGGTGIWQQLVTSLSMPSSAQIPFNNLPIFELAICASNPNHLYMYWGDGNIYSSVNKGATWTITGFSTVAYDPGIKALGNFMACDPANENVVWTGTPASGVFFSTNGGTSWTAIGTGTIAAGGACCDGLSTATYGGGNIIAFDPSSSVSGGKTQGIYIASYGTGVYHSTNGGATWALTSSGPTTYMHMVCDQTGTLWLVSLGVATSDQLWKYASGTWTKITTTPSNGNYADSISIDPNNSAHLVYSVDDGQIAVSNNTGGSWTGFSTISRVATDIPWLANTNETFMSVGDMAFDSSSVLWFAEGIGVWETGAQVEVRRHGRV